MQMEKKASSLYVFSFCIEIVVISHLRRGMSLRATKGSEAISSICAPHLEIASSLRSSQRPHPPKTEVLQIVFKNSCICPEIIIFIDGHLKKIVTNYRSFMLFTQSRKEAKLKSIIFLFNHHYNYLGL
jgi:hypothetical protein